MEINEIKAVNALNRTSINLAEYVLNPYRGCEFACLYCYNRFNKVNKKDSRKWGEYLEVRTNIVDLLKKEIVLKKPRSILLGSTTECFQPFEEKSRVMRDILTILNSERIPYYILTRSPLSCDYVNLLRSDSCKGIYFTVNNYSEPFRSIFEPKAPSFESRIECVKELLSEDVRVIPYFSPVLPWISRYDAVSELFPGASRIEFEFLNFNLGNIAKIIEAIRNIDESLGERYGQMITNGDQFRKVWDAVKMEIRIFAERHSIKEFYMHEHEFFGFFHNRY
ncbi:MAG: radical SAM protein [Candidatus Omnitrophica bacterium]|nr:radical SAM protein [Candidatus Omnitrophota bacterium]